MKRTWAILLILVMLIGLVPQMTLTAHAADGSIWEVWSDDKRTGAFDSLHAAVAACSAGGTIRLTADCAATSGAVVDKVITIDGNNHLVDISGCSGAFITVGEGVEVTVCDLKLDGGADGFEVNYAGVTYTDFTIGLVSGSLRGDPKNKQSAIVSSGTLICRNVDISNRYTSAYGGAMKITAGSAHLIDCDFTHNYGASYGGALYIGSKFGGRKEYPVKSVKIENCTFTDNYTQNGGAIYAFNTAEIVITDSVFDSNTANGGKGGAIDLAAENTSCPAAEALGLPFMVTTVNGCTFTNNWAGNDGFAIQTFDSDLYVTDSRFIGNVGVHPTSSVGTVSVEHYRKESWRLYTRLEGCLFLRNYGACASYGDHSSPSDLDVSNCIFRENEGMMSFLLYSAVSNLTNCQFFGEKMSRAVIDARIYENWKVSPLLTLKDTFFVKNDSPADLLVRKQGHDERLNTYRVVLQGTTRGDITIWDNNVVAIWGNHTGNVQLDESTEKENLILGSIGSLNGTVTIPFEGTIVMSPPESDAAQTGESDGTYGYGVPGLPMVDGCRMVRYAIRPVIVN